MSKKLITDCWQIILHNKADISIENFLPLYKIENFLLYFELPLCSKLNEITRFPISSKICKENSSFKTLTETNLFSLQYNIYNQTELYLVGQWAEKLLRFCEIRFSELKKRTLIKCKNNAAARKHMLHLTCFFMDYYFVANDLRFLNIALKLADLKWLLKTNKIQAELEKNTNDLDIALFMFRVVLSTECAIEQIKKGKQNERCYCTIPQQF